MQGELSVFKTMEFTRPGMPWSWTLYVDPRFEVRAQQRYKSAANAARAGRAAAKELGINVPRRQRRKCIPS